ncbi:MAG: hypothetical protein QOH91_3010 [Mycobacterium sp.]|jgi:hypothetical protein|nr:hypothetical protein [Mycobacterium sp.]
MTERSWWRSTRSGETQHPYGAGLRAELGFTPVYLRYNTGFHISQNGRDLADLLIQLCELWPVGSASHRRCRSRAGAGVRELIRGR